MTEKPATNNFLREWISKNTVVKISEKARLAGDMQKLFNVDVSIVIQTHV